MSRAAYEIIVALESYQFLLIWGVFNSSKGHSFLLEGSQSLVVLLWEPHPGLVVSYGSGDISLKAETRTRVRADGMAGPIC